MYYELRVLEPRDALSFLLIPKVKRISLTLALIRLTISLSCFV